ncbi:MFS transporter [Streptomyces sp. NBC_00378]|uniref:MFS transporter n=1 Tax=unclassified Streptomyces TaxID=2593676 RepID=UPI0022555582|nr:MULTISPECIES: MFS transporter [unclassified Streptomyces]MCX5112504.1 MFS transporter [Streptomyces sp. NBC_00378]
MSENPTRPSPADRVAWLGLVAISLGVSLVVVDFTIVNVVMPPIIDDLKISAFGAQWIQESYAIILAALLLLMGRFSDLVGARRLFLIGTVIFGLASVAAALSPNGEFLITSRFVQGVGGATVMPTSLALLNMTFRGPDRSKAFAVWGSTIGAAAAVGPLLGGWLAEYSWRWAFGINIFAVLLILVGSMKFLQKSPRQPGRIDAVGGVLSVLGLGLLAFGLIEGRNYGWWGARKSLGPFGDGVELSVVPVALAISVVSLVLFLCLQVRLTRKNGTAPLMDTSLFGIKSFSTGNIATLIIALAEFGILAVLPLWLQYTLGCSAVQTGLMVFVVAIGSFSASGASFGMAEKAGPIGLVRIGLVLEAIGLLMFGLLASSDSPWWVIGIALFLYGTGVGFATAQVTNVVLADVPPQQAGQGSGIQSAARQLGSALGIAVLTSTFFTALASDLSDRLAQQGTPGADQLASAVSDSAGAMISGLSQNPETESAAAAARDAMSHAIQINGYTCAALLAFGMLATFLIPRRKPDAQQWGEAHAPGGAPDTGVNAEQTSQRSERSWCSRLPQ